MDIGLVLLIIGSIYLGVKTGVGFMMLVGAMSFLVLAFQNADEPLILIVGIGASIFLFYYTFFGGESK